MYGRRAGTTPARSADRSPAVDDDGLAGHEVTGLRTHQYRGAGDLVRHADAQERRTRGGRLQRLRVVPQRFREISLDQAGRDAVHADVVLAVFAGKVARDRKSVV